MEVKRGARRGREGDKGRRTSASGSGQLRGARRMDAKETMYSAEG